MSNTFIDPQVIKDAIATEVKTKMKFRSIATVDNSLNSVAGSILTLPVWGYIGDAVDLAKGDSITLKDLAMTSTTVAIKQVGNGGKIYDREVATGFGDPKGQLVSQISTSILNKLDADCFTALAGATLTKDVSVTSHLNGGAVADGLTKFGEDLSGNKFLYVSAGQLAQIRKDPQYIVVSKMAEIPAGVDNVGGEIWGCVIIVSDRIVAVAGKITNYIVKDNGALTILMKKEADVETDRNILDKSTAVTGDMLYAVYLSDQTRAIKLIVSETVVA
jgi:N4-gp56 family major capsid protein